MSDSVFRFRPVDSAVAVAPGLFLCGAIAAVAMLVARVPFVADGLHLGTAILAIVFGAAFRNTVGLPPAAEAGVRFTLKRLLRLAIVLLGFRLLLQDLASIGLAGALVVTASVVAGLMASYGICRGLGLNTRLSMMMATGHAICGASAIAAAEGILRGGQRDTACAIGVVSLLGTVTMFLFPALDRVVELPAGVYGAWAGTSIHNVAQVVAAGFAAGAEEGTMASLFKLARIVFLFPLLLVLAAWAARAGRPVGDSRKASAREPFPWFVVGFVAVIALNTTGLVPEVATAVLLDIDAVLLALAMAGIGLGVDIGEMRALGPRPLIAGAMSTAVLAGIMFVLATLMLGNL